ncbi:hypothetical protein CBM2626_A140177 [Cupriavidus taiwanensis]|nr:hypothetical protein CBM2614_A210404 [Cupriavidus taiwanensis]SOZ98080.1 hypothetical protein CBM2626_A140177 [Cupriavidus taiwanensis]
MKVRLAEVKHHFETVCNSGRVQLRERGFRKGGELKAEMKKASARLAFETGGWYRD